MTDDKTHIEIQVLRIEEEDDGTYSSIEELWSGGLEFANLTESEWREVEARFRELQRAVRTFRKHPMYFEHREEAATR